MAAKKTLALFILFSAVCVLVVYGFTKDEKPFGVTGKIKFEDETPAGTVVVYTTGEDSPLRNKEEGNYIQETLLEDGSFFRPVTDLGGKDINIWIYREGYPVIHSTRVLNPREKSIDFGEVFIPGNLKKQKPGVVAATPLEGYHNICLEGQPYPVNLNEVQCIQNFSRRSFPTNDCLRRKASTVFKALFLYDTNKQGQPNSTPEYDSLFFGQ